MASERLPARLSDAPPFMRLMFIGIVLIASATLLTFAIYYLIAKAYGLPDFKTYSESVDEQIKNIAATRLLTLCYTIATFAVPALLFSYFSTGSLFEYQSFKKRINPAFITLAILFVVVSTPLIQAVYNWNQHIVYPGALKDFEKWATEKEGDADKLTFALLEPSGPLSYIVIFITIALLPAVCEEMFFRGTLQNFFRDWTKNPHVAIIVTGILFSAFHFQFYGFVPRAMLGIAFGYFYYWSGNLWMTIAAHFANNALQLIVYYAYERSFSDPAQADESIPVYLALISLVLTLALMYACYKIAQRMKSMQVVPVKEPENSTDNILDE